MRKTLQKEKEWRENPLYEEITPSFLFFPIYILPISLSLLVYKPYKKHGLSVLSMHFILTVIINNKVHKIDTKPTTKKI